jgi:hypothetical protein
MITQKNTKPVTMKCISMKMCPRWLRIRVSNSGLKYRA